MNEDMNSFYHRSASNITMIWAAIASVGWFILAGVVALFCASPYIGEKYKNWKSKRDEAEYAAKYHKNPELFAETLSAVETARQKMLEKYKEQSEIAKQKVEERKNLKKKELSDLTSKLQSGRKLGSNDDAPSTSHSSTFNGEYNPLMGDNSRGYKPPKRSCCGKKCG